MCYQENNDNFAFSNYLEARDFALEYMKAYKCIDRTYKVCV